MRRDLFILSTRAQRHRCWNAPTRPCIEAWNVERGSNANKVVIILSTESFVSASNGCDRKKLTSSYVFISEKTGDRQRQEIEGSKWIEFGYQRIFKRGDVVVVVVVLVCVIGEWRWWC